MITVTFTFSEKPIRIPTYNLSLLWWSNRTWIVRWQRCGDNRCRNLCREVCGRRSCWKGTWFCCWIRCGKFGRGLCRFFWIISWAKGIKDTVICLFGISFTPNTTRNFLKRSSLKAIQTLFAAAKIEINKLASSPPIETQQALDVSRFNTYCAK